MHAKADSADQHVICIVQLQDVTLGEELGMEKVFFRGARGLDPGVLQAVFFLAILPDNQPALDGQIDYCCCKSFVIVAHAADIADGGRGESFRGGIPGENHALAGITAYLVPGI